MKKEIKDRWLSKLRDPEMKQTPGALGYKSKDGAEQFCCLGVLCEIAVEDGVLTREILDNGTFQYITTDGERQRMVLPYAVQRWAEIAENPEVNVTGFDVTIDGGEREYASLSELNDYAGKSFSQIADVIDKTL